MLSVTWDRKALGQKIEQIQLKKTESLPHKQNAYSGMNKWRSDWKKRVRFVFFSYPSTCRWVARQLQLREWLLCGSGLMVFKSVLSGLKFIVSGFVYVHGLPTVCANDNKPVSVSSLKLESGDIILSEKSDLLLFHYKCNAYKYS